LIVVYRRPQQAIPSASGGPIIQVPRSSVVFHGSRHSGFSRSRRFRDPPVLRVSPLFFGVPPTFRVSGSPHYFAVTPTFGEVWLSPKVWLSSKVCPSPDFGLSITRPPSVRHTTPVCPSPDNGLSVTRPPSVRHLTPVCPSPDIGLSVTRPPSVRHLTSVCPSPDTGLSVTRQRSVRHPTSVCPSPDLRLSVTRHRSVRHPTSVCPSPDNGLSVTRHRSVRHPTPRSVCHSTSVCPSPDFLPGRFHLAPSQSPSSEHGPGRLSGRSRPPSFQLGGWGLLSCSSVGGWPFSVPGGSAGFASASLSRSHWIYL
jgi:uncharacterized protein YbbK (DUF523 family)